MDNRIETATGRARSEAADSGSMLRILIADDHDLLRDTLVTYLQREGDIATETAPDLAGVVAILDAGTPFDLVLLDYAMPGMNGLEGLERVMAMPGRHRVALISGTANRETAQKALSAGAAGFLPKTLTARSLVNAVRFMSMGEQYLPLGFMNAQEEVEAAHPLTQSLSRRELEVLEGLTHGKSNKEIARDLDIREPTVKLHVKTLYRKIGAANRTQAAMMAKEAGLF